MERARKGLWILFPLLIFGYITHIDASNLHSKNERDNLMQNRLTSLNDDVEIHLHKREIFRRVSSCPEECSCDVLGNANKIVDCFNSGLVDIPQDIPGDAINLNMSRNIVMAVKSGLLDNLRDLKIIDFSHNNIKEIQRNALKDQDKLKYLDLSYNKLANISLDDLRQSARFLEVLNISATDVREIPELYDEEGVYMSKLTHLSMGKNFFPSIPPSRIPTSVKYLDLSCLNVRTLKNSGLSGLDLLEELILRGCPTPKGRIKALEDKALATSVRLKILDLSNNDLSSVPYGLPPSLEFLDLSNNKITTIKKSECATEPDMQKKLYVNSQNEYDEFGDGHLTRPVGSALSPLSNLKELRLNGNPIASLCMDEFANMEQLKILNISGCRLSSFHPHTFVYTRSLQVLDLSNNQLTRFKTDEITMLEELYVQYNLLENTGDLDRRRIPVLEKADFSGNPWRCNCEIKPLLQLLAYSRNIHFENLHLNSVYYSCSVPLKVKGKALMTLDSDELPCEEETEISIWAIAAPASLVGLIIIIVIVIVISTRRDARRRRAKRIERGQDVEEEGGCCSCCCCGCCKKKEDNYSKRIPDTRRNFDYPSDTLVRKNALLNDAAILCNVKDQKWILNKMIPEVHRYRDEESQKGKDHNPPSKKLNMNVFTIGQSIKIERLSKCIDANRKIVLVITHNFVEEEPCILVLNIIRERMVRDPKDSVILLILDAISWSTMPQCLQFLMVEKTFVQYPQDSRGRQEYYFWDSVCSHIYSKTLRSLLPPVPEESDNLAFETEDAEKPIQEPPSVLRQQPMMQVADSEEVFPPMRPSGWNTGGRHMKGWSTMNPPENEWISPERQAKLNRLGLHRDGHLVDGAYAGIAEARNLGEAQKKNYQGKLVPTNLPMQHIESIRRDEREDIASVHKDIDDLYSTRGSVIAPRAPTSRRTRSLLPANADDADSIYSEDEEMANRMIQAPERQRSLPTARTSHLHASGPGSDHLASLHSRVSAEQLHGTDKNFRMTGAVGHDSSLAGAVGANVPEPIPEEPVAGDGSEEDEEDGSKKKKKKKSKKNKKNKSKKKKKK